MAATNSSEVNLAVDGSPENANTCEKTVTPEKEGESPYTATAPAPKSRRFSWDMSASPRRASGVNSNLGPGRRQSFGFAAPEASGLIETQPTMIPPWRLFTFASKVDLVLLLLGCMAAFMQGLLLPIIGILVGGATGATAPGKSAAADIAPMMGNFGLFMVSLCVSGTLWQWAFLSSAERQCAKMRKAYFNTVLKKDMSWFDANSATEVPTRISTQVGDVQDALGSKTGQIIVCMGQFTGGLVCAVTTGPEAWKLTLLLLTASPFIALAGVGMAKALKEESNTKQKGFDQGGAIVEEAISSIRTIASFGGENLTVERFLTSIGPAKRAGIVIGLSVGCASGLSLSMIAVQYALAFWYAANFSESTGAEAVQVFFCMVVGLGGLQDASGPVMTWAMALCSGAKMFQIFDTNKQEIECCDAEGEVGKEVGTIQELHFRDLEFSFPTRLEEPILRGVSLCIVRNQKVAFVGESGSGKSTMVQLILRFYNPTWGAVTVNGEDLRGLSLKWWRRQLGYVGQEPVLFATSVKRNITNEDSSLTESQVLHVMHQAQAYDFVMKLPEKFNTKVGTGGSQMSGGQKQRIAIARALLRKPQILILDEATSALDNESERLVQATIDKIQADPASGLTTISIAHRLSTILNSDRIFFFNFGVMEEQGSHAELMASEGGYSYLVKSREQDKQLQPSLVVSESQDDTVEGQPSDHPVDEPHPHVMGEVSVASLVGPSIRSLGSHRSSFTEVLSDAAVDKKRLADIAMQKYKPPHMRLLRLSRPEWWLFPLALVGCMLSGCVIPVMGYMMSILVEYFYLYTGDELISRVNRACLMYVGLFFANFIGEVLRWGIFSCIQESLAARLRCMCIEGLIRQDMAFFDDPSSGVQGLPAVIERKVKEVAQVTGISLGNVVMAVCATLSGITLAFLGSWQLSLACLGTFPVVSFTIGMSMTIFKAGGSSAATYSHAGAILSEAILNIRTVRSLQREQHAVDSYWKVIWKAAKQKSGRDALRSGMIYGLSTACIYIIYIVGFAYGLWLVDQRVITQKEMFQSIFCILFGSIALCCVTSFSPDAAKAKLASYDVFSVIDRKSKLDALNPEGTHRSLGDGSIAFEGVEFTYPHRPTLVVLRGLTFTVRSGQSVALVGQSGCGKSTVMQLLQRFYDPAAGQVLVGGVPLSHFDVAWWRRQVSLVGQEPVLFDMTLEDNIIYGASSSTRAEVEAAARMANMDYALSGRFGWEDSVGLKGHKLSGGQKQRCAIARAVIRDPKILLLDEATSALDSRSEGEVQQALDNAQAGRTTFTIAHRLSTIMHNDVIIVMKNGVLAEEGTHKELLDMGCLYAKLWGASETSDRRS